MNSFRIAITLLVAGVIYLFYTSRIRKIRREEAQKTVVRSKVIELEQKLLRSQMNPHFIFNSLSSIQQLIISDNRMEANEYLVRFSSLIRKTLQLSTRPFIKLREEQEYLGEYLALEQARLTVPFTFKFELDIVNSADDIEIPHMLIQPILENSIRHGVKHLENRQGHIQIIMKQERHYLRCTVTDNGVGRNSAASGTDHTRTLDHKSYGIDIVKKRLHILQDQSIDEELLTVTDLRNEKGVLEGTSVTLLLPYKINQS